MAEPESFETDQLGSSKAATAGQEDDEEEMEDSENESEVELERGGGGGVVSELQPTELRTGSSVSEAVVRGSCSETLTVLSMNQSSENGRCDGLPVNSAAQSLEGAELKPQARSSRNEPVAVEATQTDKVQEESQLQVSTCKGPDSDQSPTSVTQSISSSASPSLSEHKMSPKKVQKECKAEPSQKNSSNHKTASSVPNVRTPASDGYNWRKYGQKQVKSPKGSRSYYKCTYSECFAKKIECCDHSGKITGTVYKSQHSHDPPRKISIPKESRLVPYVEPVVKKIIAEHSRRVINDSDPPMPSKEPLQETAIVLERKRQYSNDSDGNDEFKIKDENDDEPETKQKVKKSSAGNSGTPLKPGKKPKFVVHAAGDVGISGDGYRWRKYGQKMVKGNAHPRNYYRCTSAGCPVRKHIESAVENPNAVIITYKGVHDHDMPVPKKRHGPPSAPLVAAAAPVSMIYTQPKKTDAVQSQISSTQWSVDAEGELTGEALELGGEKAMESARTLLSIGFEIKPC
ncbi:probable WRKY transcription factor 32 [Benincasa hispida]|uniref:probable WRKY transcription factor 32 n=1 Tax=Benincasa hispida TaxID=102211 RepID=UPI001900FFDC|nr:probable WRKY transcription factor 32 [Benincasa hispida]